MDKTRNLVNDVASEQKLYYAFVELVYLSVLKEA
jgi:hypothetical protein